MSNFETKMRVVFIPYLVIAVSTFVGYSFLRWMLDIKMHLLPLKDDILNFWIPGAISLLVAVIFLRKRVRVLKIRDKKDNGFFMYQFLPALFIAIPLLIFQSYLEQTAYELAHVKTVNEININKPSRYLQIDHYFAYKDSAQWNEETTTTGKNSETLVFTLYVAVPMFADSISVNTNPLFWYGVKYSDDVSNNLSDTKKEAAWKSFAERSAHEFDSLAFNKEVYFENIPYSDAKDGYFNAIKKNYKIAENKLNILEPRFKAFDNDGGNSLAWVLGSFAGGVTVFFIMVMIPGVNTERLKVYMDGKEFKDDGVRELVSFIIPKGDRFSTSLLVDINVLVFIFMMLRGVNPMSTSGTQMLLYGGVRRAEVLSGEYWRLFSSMFVHAGIMHLLYNIFGLVIGGLLLEPIIKKYWILVVYVFTGLGAALMSISWHDDTISVGASGAIFGLYGAVIGLLITGRVPKVERKGFWFLIAIYAGGSLLYGLAGGIDNAAHIGGLICGIVIGFVISVVTKRPINRIDNLALAPKDEIGDDNNLNA